MRLGVPNGWELTCEHRFGLRFGLRFVCCLQESALRLALNLTVLSPYKKLGAGASQV